MKREVVGVKLLETQKEYDEYPFAPVKNKMAYCNIVKMASTGKTLKSDAAHFGCPGGSTALGLRSLDKERLSGKVFYEIGLFKDLPMAKQCQMDTRRIENPIVGVALGPLALLVQYDVAIIIDTPYNIMRIVQGYTHQYGIQKSFCLSGNQAVCSECTTSPFLTQQVNISTLCAGTRFRCKWADEDMAIGIPACQYEHIKQGVAATLNSTEPDTRKIVLSQTNPSLDIQDHTAYFYHFNKD